MSKFGIIPQPEPPVIASLDGLAPRFRASVEQLLNLIPDAMVRESLRTDKRQQWLYGFGRLYDDGRGIVTNAATCRYSWHFFGVAADFTHKTLGDDAPREWWGNFVDKVEWLGLVSGMRFRGSLGDKNHVQSGPPMRLSPSWHAYALYLTSGRQGVWKAVGAA